MKLIIVLASGLISLSVHAQPTDMECRNQISVEVAESENFLSCANSVKRQLMYELSTIHLNSDVYKPKRKKTDLIAEDR